MIERAFVDSGAFVAFLVRSSPDHAAFVDLFRQPPPRLFTSALVVAETYDWLRRMTSAGTEMFSELLVRLPNLDLLAADFAHARAVERKLSAHAARDLSYIAASTLVFLGEHRILDVWGADPILGLEGAKVWPGLGGESRLAGTPTTG